MSVHVADGWGRVSVHVADGWGKGNKYPSYCHILNECCILITDT